MDDREEFEKWANNERLYLGLKSGKYFEPRTVSAWKAWQARQAELDELKAEVARLRAER